MNIHILVLVIAIILFGLLAFKQMSALILAPLVTSFVIICSGMPILDSLKNLFMPAAAEYVTSYFLVFFVGALFGAVYQYTGAAESIRRSETATFDRTCDRQFMSRKICSTDHYDHHWFINLWWCQRIRCILCYLPYRT